MALKTINIKTSAALGTLAEAILAAVEVKLKDLKKKFHENTWSAL